MDPPLMVPLLRRHEPVALVSGSVALVLSRVPVILTWPPLVRVNPGRRRPAVVYVPPRFRVLLSIESVPEPVMAQAPEKFTMAPVALMEPWLVQFVDVMERPPPAVLVIDALLVRALHWMERVAPAAAWLVM